MVKKLLTIIMGLGLAFSAAAQMGSGNETVSQSDIQFWTGTGSNRAVLAITWDDEDAGAVGIAWGVQWNGNAVVRDLLDTMLAYDSRLTVNFNSNRSLATSIGYTDDELGLDLMSDENTFWYPINGSFTGLLGIAYDTVHEGDFVDFIEWTVDEADYMFMATDPNGSASTNYPFAGSSVQYWAGNGSNSAVVGVGFNGTVLVWGVRWNGSVHVDNLLDTINTADSRMQINGINSCYTDFMEYTDGSINYQTTGAGIMYKVNGSMASSICSQSVAAGDYIFFSDNFSFPANSYVFVSDPNGASDTTVTDTTEVPVDATIAASDILYWVGEGSNEVVLAVNWADTALAWGYRFSTDSTTVQESMTAIAEADPRLSITDNAGWLNDILFVENGDTLSALNPGWWMSTYNGNSNASAGMTQVLRNGDFFKWGDYMVGTTIDTVTYAMVFTATIYPVSAPAIDDTTEAPVDATIAASDILYWVGEGSNEVVLAVNWADTALAWGYRFSTDSTTVQESMTAIAEADPRLSITDNAGWLNDILFIENGDTLSALNPGWWMSTYNGNSNASAGMTQVLRNGDFFKWGDYMVGTTIDTVTYAMVFTDEIYPVSVPAIDDTTTTDTTIVTPEHGPFCGGVGTEGCNAIKADSSAIVAWATGIELNRGPQNISVMGSPLASYGTADSAIGPASDNNMRAVSLGDGGTATITFAHPIRNGEGPDFAVFENGFENLVYGNYSLELAFVEVSSDGERFVRFPATSLTQTENQTANAGSLDPTNINNLAGKYEVGYGTPFDLAELADSTGIDIDSIVYVRIVDVVGSIDSAYATHDAFGHIINDPWPTPFASSGFDLTGVAVMYERIDTVPVEPIEPTLVDATIAASEIRYWVGEGSNQVILAVNWVDSALAWGYRFASDSTTVQDVMTAIAEADSRFSFSGEGWLNDILFVENGDTLSALNPGWWMSTYNGNSNASAGMTQVLRNGDFFKWGDYMVGTTIDTVTYAMVFTDEIYPVSEPVNDTTGINVAENVVLSIYPNPAVNVVTVTVKADTDAILFDMAGRRVMAITLREGRNSLDLSALESGVYMLRTAGSVEKIVKR